MSYGQFCAVARAMEILGERWSLLVVREVLLGSRRFSDIQRGIPRVSRTMLSARLRALCDAGVLARTEGDAGNEYVLTQSGEELRGIVLAVGTWGQRWLPRELPEEQLDVDELVWDMRRRVRREALPAEPLVVRVEFSDLPASRRRRYLLLRRAEVSLCVENPGYPEELVLEGSRRTLIAWWRGDLSLNEARREGLKVTGEPKHVRAVGQWFERYLLAEVQPVREAG